MSEENIKVVEKGHSEDEVMIYTLSTCGWCKKTKRLLDGLDISYRYIDVDLLDEEESEKVVTEIEKLNPRCSYPTIVINGICIAGFNEEKIKKALKPKA